MTVYEYLALGLSVSGIVLGAALIIGDLWTLSQHQPKNSIRMHQAPRHERLRLLRRGWVK